MGKNRAPAPRMQLNVTWKNAIKRDWQLYLLLLIPVALVIIFCYAAYPGLRMVFMDYKPAKGYDGSKWVGMATFAKVFKDADFHRALRNSLVFNFLDLLVGFPMPIILALILNELRYPRFKKVTQTILYLPHFLSWVIIGSVAYQIFRPSTGMINIVLQNMGLIKEGIPFLTEKWHWASPLEILIKVYLPVSLPALATVVLFALVNHWNDYFSGLLYMSKAEMYPLQTYIQQLTVDLTQITDANQLKQLASMNNRTFNATKIVVSTIPLLIIYPFLQKYFVTGMVIGAVKE